MSPMSVALLRLRAEVGVNRVHEDGPSSIVAKKRALRCASPGALDEAGLFQALCAASVPFVTVEYLRRLVEGEVALPSCGRSDVPQSEFRFPVGAAASTPRTRLQPDQPDLFAVLSTTEGEPADAADSLSEARDLLLTIVDAGGGEKDLLFWPFLCEDALSSDSLARDRMFNHFRVSSILRCSAAKSVVRLV